MDVMKNLLKRARDDEFFLRFSKRSTIFWAGALILIAFLTRKNDSVLNAAFALRGLTSGALLGSLMLTLLWRKENSLPVVIAMFTALSVMTTIFVKTNIFWPWYTLIGTIILLLTAYLLRLFLRDEEA